MGQYERVGLWVIVGATALFTVINFSSIGSLDETVGQNTAKLDQPAVRPTAVAGIPAALEEQWTKAVTEEGAEASAGGTWVTVQLTNQGYGEAGVVTAELDFARDIERLAAIDAEGGVLSDGTYGGPSVEEGGTGERAATVEFGELPAGQSSFIFVKLADGVAGGVAPAALPGAAATWRSIMVTAKEDRWDDESVTNAVYAPVRADVPVEAKAPEAGKAG